MAPLGGGQVGGDGLRSHSGDVRERRRECAQRFFVARDEDKIVSGGCELPAKFFTYSGRGSGDECCSHGGSVARSVGVSRGRGRDFLSHPRPGLVVNGCG